MMMKGSSSTFICALVGLTIFLCVINGGQGLKCYQSGLSPDKKSIEDKETVCPEVEGCTAVCTKRTEKIKSEANGTNGVPYYHKQCGCRELFNKNGCDAEGKLCSCDGDLCNTDSGNIKSGATTTKTTPIMAFSTLPSALALAIITSILLGHIHLN